MTAVPDVHRLRFILSTPSQISLLIDPFSNHSFCRAVLLVVLALGAQKAALAQSFHCNEARTVVEIAICANPKLSALDTEVAKKYDADAMHRLNPLLADDQRVWLNRRDYDCVQNRAPDTSLDDCLLTEYSDRLAFLRQEPATKQKIEAEGMCRPLLKYLRDQKASMDIDLLTTGPHPQITSVKSLWKGDAKSFEDLKKWGNNQRPQINVEALRDPMTGKGLTDDWYLVELEGTRLVALTQACGGSIPCVNTIFFDKKLGKADVVWDPDGSDGESRLGDRFFGYLAGTPILFEELADEVDLTRSIEIAPWVADNWGSNACVIQIAYAPKLAKKANADSKDKCDRTCADLYSAVRDIVAKLQHDPKVDVGTPVKNLTAQEALDFAVWSEHVPDQHSSISAPVKPLPIRFGKKLYFLALGHYPALGGGSYTPPDWVVDVYELLSSETLFRTEFEVGMTFGDAVSVEAAAATKRP